MLLPGYGWDVCDDDADPHDDLQRGFLKFPGHGTSTASIIGSRGAASQVMGTAPAVHAIPFRISESVVHLSMANMVRGIQLAVERNVHVISLSAGGLWSAALHRAVRDAVDAGVIVVAAAGNYTEIVVWPARFAEVISCGAINASGGTWIWSNGDRGEHVTVMAPGEDVWVLRPTSQTEIIVDPGSGTSFATACVAGAIATWLGFHGRDALIARYGRANLAAVAKAHLRALTAVGDQAGVLDMVALLSADLPLFPPTQPPIDALASALESVAESRYADELLFRDTVAKLTRSVPAPGDVPPVGTLGALETVAMVAPALPMSTRLAKTLRRSGGQ
jgi:subtilisin family serine protease